MSNLLHSIYIEPSKELESYIYTEYLRFSKNYKDLRTHEFKIHLSVYSAFLDEEATDEFIKRSLHVFSTQKPFFITLDKFTCSQNGYILIELDKVSREKVLSLHTIAVDTLQDLEQCEKSKYSFDAHISFTKLVSKNNKELLPLLNSMSGKSFLANELILTKQHITNDGMSKFPVIKRIGFA